MFFACKFCDFFYGISIPYGAIKRNEFLKTIKFSIIISIPYGAIMMIQKYITFLEIPNF